MSHNPSGPLGITSPTANQLIQLLNGNYNATGNVPFSAGTNTTNSISWSATLQYATSSGSGTISDNRPFNTSSGQEHDETYQKECGQVKVTAQTSASDGGTVQDCVTFYVEGAESGIPNATITSDLDNSYQTSKSYPNDGTATLNLMTGVAMKESSYRQFVTPAEGNSDLFNLYAKTGIEAKWPDENVATSQVPRGAYLGLMQVQTATNQATDPNAWDWTTNAGDAVNLFSGATSPNKITIAAGYENDIINGVKSPKIPGHVGLVSLTGFQLENMALVLYAGDVPSNESLATVLTQQYYMPQCPAPGVQGTNKQGNLTCSTGWQWIVNTVNQSAGVNYVSNGSTGVRDLRQ